MGETNKHKLLRKETLEAIQQLSEAFSYKDGTLLWRKKVARKVVVGARAGCGHPIYAYRYVKLNGVKFCEHRVIWALHYGCWPKQEIDHINHDRSDNRIENLRDVSPRVNQLTKPMCKNNTSGAKGVRWRKDRRTWQAYSGVFGKFKSIGHFASQEDAVNARAVWLETAL